jgi:hypothetical protein
LDGRVLNGLTFFPTGDEHPAAVYSFGGCAEGGEGFAVDLEGGAVDLGKKTEGVEAGDDVAPFRFGVVG